MKYIAALSLIAVVSAATNQTIESPVIPTTGISSGCTTFLQQLDADAALTTCLKALNGATSLQALCASPVTSACPGSLFKTQLTSMSSACNAEIGGDSPNPTVLALYDSLFAASPFQAAVCTQDSSSGSLCVDTLTTTAGSSLTSVLSTANTYLTSTLVPVAAFKRGAAPTAQVTFPNATTYKTSGLPFLFLTPSSPSSILCTSCAQKIVKTYVDFETTNPYAIGINASPLLGQQNAIYGAMTATCGTNVSGEVVANAGAAPSASVAQGSLASAASPSVPSSFAAIAFVSVASLLLL